MNGKPSTALVCGEKQRIGSRFPATTTSRTKKILVAIRKEIDQQGRLRERTRTADTLTSILTAAATMKGPRNPSSMAALLLLVVTVTTVTAASTVPTQDGCSLYLAPNEDNEALTLYTGVNIKEGSVVGSPETMLPLVDMNQNVVPIWVKEFGWHALVSESLSLESRSTMQTVIPGVGSLITCSEGWTNVRNHPDTVVAGGGGAYSNRRNYHATATQDIPAGQGLFLNCGNDGGVVDVDSDEDMEIPQPKSIEWLQENAVCVDGLQTRPSTLEGAGEGAYATRSFSKGSAVTVSPVFALDKHDLRITSKEKQNLQSVIRSAVRKHNETKATTPVASSMLARNNKQIMLNYCFGHEQSDILLFPYGPVVTHMNHQNKGKANVVIRWADTELSNHHDASFLERTMRKLLDQPQTLAIEYVALVDIAEGDELFLDYGDRWSNAWQHQSELCGAAASADNDDDTRMVSAAQYKADTPDLTKQPIRTVEEQKKDPYPENLMTVCYFAYVLDREYFPEYDEEDYEEEDYYIDPDEPIVTEYDETVNGGCLRPCQIIERNGDSYTAIMQDMPSRVEECTLWLPEDIQERRGYAPVTHEVRNIPRHRIDIADRPYTSELHSPVGFRQAIGTPDGFYPKSWLRKPFDEPSFVAKDLAAGEMSQTRWSDTNETVAKYAYEIGLNPKLRNSLLDYATRIGVTDIFRNLLIDGDPLPPGTDQQIVLNGNNWYVDRPAKHWNSNMHWISPRDESAHDDFLRALGAGGFDDYLDAVGRHFGLDTLVLYHVTFIGVSHCENGYMHHDFQNVDGKAFNMIVPLILANETGPGLELQQDFDLSKVGKYQYRYNVGSMVGDHTEHATGSCDYRDQGEMRMAATIYFADVGVDTAPGIIDSFTQLYPPPDAAHLFRRRGKHWAKDDPSKKLPGPIVVSKPPVTQQSDGTATTEKANADVQLIPVEWSDSDLSVPNLHHVRLPEGIVELLVETMKETNVDDAILKLISKEEEFPVGHKVRPPSAFGKWTATRVSSDSDLHTVAPANKRTFNHLLAKLGKGGFGAVLESIGKAFGHSNLCVYEIAYFAVHYSPPQETSRPTWTVASTSDGLYEMVIPLRLAEDVGPEVIFAGQGKDNDDSQDMYFKNSIGYGYLMGDGVKSILAPHDYQIQKQIRIGLSVRLAEFSEEALVSIMDSITQDFPIKDPLKIWQDVEYHWKADDDNIQLPRR